MKPGPPPKPAALRQRRNRPKLAVLPPPAARPEDHPPPRGLAASTRRQWRRFWESELAQYMQTTDLPALRRLFALYDEWTRSHQVLRESARLVRGSMGQVVLNPLVGYMLQIEKAVVGLEDRFGLNLSARQRLGLNELKLRSLAELNARFHPDIDQAEDEDDPAAALLEPGRDRGGAE